MKNLLIPVVINVVAWTLATFNLVFVIYIWRHGP